MKNELIDGRVWKTLTKFAKQNTKVAYVAVPYFGKKGSKLLPLPAGSRLVVDASDDNIKTHAVCPAELLALHYGGVAVYDCPNLHAKVYAFSRRAYVGSANVSKNSEETLIETLLCTTDPRIVAQVKEAVIQRCMFRLGPERLKEMQKVYDSYEARQHNKGNARRTLPRVCLAQVRAADWTEEEEQEGERGAETAEKARTHGTGWTVDRFCYMHKPSFRERDLVMQVTKEQDGSMMISPPGEVLPLHPFPTKRGPKYIVYLEVPERQRRSSQRLAKLLGAGGRKLLKRNGVIVKRADAARLLRVWGIGVQ